jgi:hypothetical protein
MTRKLFGVVVVSLALGSTALSQGSEHAWLGLFPERPCQDGWSGCIVEGFSVDAGAGHDSRGLPQPSDLRLGWFDLAPTPVYSPFMSLSTFTGEEAVAAPATLVEAEAAAEASIAEADEAFADAAAVTEDSTTRNETTYASDEVGDFPRPGADAYEPAAVASAKSPNWGGRSGEEDDPPNWGTRSDDQPVGDAPNWGGRGNDGMADMAPPGEEVEIAPPEPEYDDSCTELSALEPSALMGRLRLGQVECIEDRMFSASQVDKDKLSRVLLVNAEAKDDNQEWERLVRRHLEEIDRSDPDLCFKYAMHLSRGGVSRAYGVIKWSGYALDNKSQWSGSTFKKRVNALYKLRAQAASRIWEQANRDLINAASNREDLKSKEGKARGQAKTFAKEWLDYARASGQDSRAAQALCESAAGSREFCE